LEFFLNFEKMGKIRRTWNFAILPAKGQIKHPTHGRRKKLQKQFGILSRKQLV
jgi:hypothetical protein